MAMRKKAKEDWHNFDFSDDRRMGQLNAFAIWSPAVVYRFAEFGRERLKSETGIRFKIGAVAKRLNRENHCVVQTKWNGYIYPNVSPHTKKFDSFYNRLETYIPSQAVESGLDFKEVEVDTALSVNHPTLLKLWPTFARLANEGKGARFQIKGERSVQEVKKYCGKYTSVQIFSRTNTVFSIMPLEIEKTGYEFWVPVLLEANL